MHVQLIAAPARQTGSATASLPGWAAPVALITVVLLVIVVARTRGHTVYRDPQRLFTRAQRLAAFSRAGNRCEHFNMLGRRCKRIPTAGDHIYPHSRGGATTMDNLQALCAWHNGIKSAKVMSPFYVSRLERRRRKYFPPGESVRVYWRYS